MKTETRRDWRSVGIAGFVVMVLPALACADETADKETKRLEGTWKIVSLKVDGDDAPAQFIQQGRWSIKGELIAISGPGGGKSTFKVDPSQSPWRIDMTGSEGPGKGKTIKGIYKLEKGRLTICFPGGKQDEPQDLPRPEKFDGGSGRSLIILERDDDE